MENSNVNKLGDKTAGSNYFIRRVGHDHGTTHGPGQITRAKKFGMS
jgi:hypothetical protein